MTTTTKPADLIAAEHAYTDTLHAFGDLTKQDAKQRSPEHYLSDGNSYVKAHPGDLITARTVSDFAVKLERRWARVEAALSALNAALDLHGDHWLAEPETLSVGSGDKWLPAVYL